MRVMVMWFWRRKRIMPVGLEDNTESNYCHYTGADPADAKGGFILSALTNYVTYQAKNSYALSWNIEAEDPMRIIRASLMLRRSYRRKVHQRKCRAARLGVSKEARPRVWWCYEHDWNKTNSVAALVQANNIESVVDSQILKVCIAKCACACL